VCALGCTIAILTIPLTDCGVDYCIQGVINNGNGTGSVGINTGCPLNTNMGNVTVQIATASMDASPGPMAPNLTHLFVSLRGIEANVDANAADDAPGWEELAPALASEPRKIDLLSSAGDASATGSIGSNAIPVGAYRQVRLRLAPMDAAMGSAVTPDGNAHALVLKDGSSFFHIGPAEINCGLFHVLPGAGTKVAIQFNRFASTISPAGNAVLLTPEFAILSSPD